MHVLQSICVAAMQAAAHSRQSDTNSALYKTRAAPEARVAKDNNNAAARELVGQHPLGADLLRLLRAGQMKRVVHWDASCSRRSPIPCNAATSAAGRR